ncbi:amidase [Tatumella citrea]|uniref:Amidase n=1 Tax=Tatumella citrea TaxID=53336 RepID=A0A1Y0LPG2_TATCI|nr:amidase [Tatumella citrea]ARU95861.1 amidase [Tatumella citrea]ARU99901.1 amidase [Tatumella citrea]
MFQPNDYPRASVGQLLKALEAREVTALQLTEWALERIATDDRRLHAISRLHSAEARATAAASDQRRATGLPAGKLEGIPLLIKDNIAVRGWSQTAGSVTLQGLVASEDAPLITRLRSEGAVLLGQTAMHELAAGITGASSLTGYTENVFHTGYSPGGSSSGSAVAVAAGYTPLAIGTDTAGSVRIPAAFAQIYGLRPTRGQVDMQGIVPLSPTQDIAGPLVSHASDLPRIYEIMTGRALTETTEPLSVGIVSELFDEQDPVGHQVRQALNFPATVRLTHVSYPEISHLASEASIIAYEFSEALAGFLADRPAARYKTLSAILDSGKHHPDLDTIFRTRAHHPGTDSDAFYQVQQRQAAFYQELVSFFSHHRINLLAYPVISQPPVRHGQPQTGSNALISATTGTPSLALPAGFTSCGMPTGLELLALRDREDLLLRAASIFSPPGSL